MVLCEYTHDTFSVRYGLTGRLTLLQPPYKMAGGGAAGLCQTMCGLELHTEECCDSTHLKLAANCLITTSSPNHRTIFLHMCLHLLRFGKYKINMM